MEEIITFENVSFSYDELENEESEKVPEYAIRNLDFSVKSGECVAVLGHNGSGKSTLAKLCNGILVPDDGAVTVFGMDTDNEDDLMEIRQHVGMVFQNPDNQIVATIVEEDVAFGPENLGVPPEEIRERVHNSLKAVDMLEYKKQPPHKLSGGQKQRVAIAGILAMNPECIIFDESTAMLDPRGRHEVMDTIRKLHSEMGKTVVYITHYMEEAAMAERVVVMEHGSIISDGTPYQVFSDIDKIRMVGLDVPQATEFAHNLRDMGWNLPKDILKTDECVNALAEALEKGGVTCGNFGD